MKELALGIIGLGTVGRSVAKILKENQDLIAARAGCAIYIKKGAVKDLSKSREIFDFPITNNIDEILNDPEIDIVLELTGGVDTPFEIAKKALRNSKSLVTANKAMLAYHRYSLQQIAGDLPIGFEASVAGGIPIIKALRDGLGANHILSIHGIINGTCNFILTKMKDFGMEFDAVLKEAQELGYAEADPTFDVGGFDAAHKLLILASIAYGIDARPNDMLIEGITQITQEDIAFAKEFGYHLKLLGIAKKDGDCIELRVHPTFLPKDAMLGKVDGVMNAISVVGDYVGETLYYGAGAGGEATASAVISDIIEIARTKSSPMLGFKTTNHILKLKPIEEITSAYYLRILVLDKPGVLAKIATILGEIGISIDTLLQHNHKHYSTLLLSTHICKEAEIRLAVARISALEVVKAKPTMIRIEK
ncbi:homoserine dehydrogenase [Helicobacter turcicus]|uniref:Homoserine dehydrogenase n=1 Tax=Helicobacter turcicus TaxID=2867412 RepID=A0ABS7JNW6_9HELI|nr:homoserine dehydrogenase [Helicobacter turcicus]MBX7491091.1 homoserine dehydrogenase [Helicobacter turcicus]MBX7545956.1 homoserine dehydrogenase [Helicobacter turcicus]